jgi:hypothetical protein
LTWYESLYFRRYEAAKLTNFLLFAPVSSGDQVIQILIDLKQDENISHSDAFERFVYQFYAWLYSWLLVNATAYFFRRSFLNRMKFPCFPCFRLSYKASRGSYADRVAVKKEHNNELHMYQPSSRDLPNMLKKYHPSKSSNIAATRRISTLENLSISI